MSWNRRFRMWTTHGASEIIAHILHWAYFSILALRIFIRDVRKLWEAFTSGQTRVNNADDEIFDASSPSSRPSFSKDFRRLVRRTRGRRTF